MLKVISLLMVVLASSYSFAGKSRLLVCPDRFGIDTFMQAEKERWSEFGLDVHVVDFYGEKKSFSDPEAQQQWAQLSSSNAEKAIQKSFEISLKDRSENTEIGLIAFQESANICLKFFGENLKIRSAIFVHPNFVREAAQGAVSDRRILVVGASEAKEFNSRAYEAYLEELKKRQFLVSEQKMAASSRDFYRSNLAKSFQPQFSFQLRKSSEEFFQKYLTFQDNRK